MNLPQPIYDAMPAINIIGGSLALYSTTVAAFSGFIMVVVGMLMYQMRLNARSARLNRKIHVAGYQPELDMKRVDGTLPPPKAT